MSAQRAFGFDNCVKTNFNKKWITLFPANYLVLLPENSIHMSLSKYALNWATYFVALGFSLLFVVACKSESKPANSNTSPKMQEKPLGHLLERYLKPYPDELTAIIDPAQAPEIVAAMEAYNAGRYEEAIDLFPNSARTMDQAGYIHLYKGISELLADKEYDAFKTFQLINSTMGKAMEISNWYLIMNYVGFNNVFEARRKLEATIAAGAYPGETAQDLLDDLPEN